MSFVFILITLAYMVAVFGLITGWIKAVNRPVPGVQQEAFITVVVPCRNEAQTIGRLLDGLLIQNYPTDKLELIVVNDHSEDHTVNVVHEKLRSSTFTGMLVNAPEPGKKAALTKGILAAKGKIIITTDADCLPGPDWVRSVNSAFQSESVKMVFGPVRMRSANDQPATLFAEMQSIEFSSLIGSGAATAAFGFPTMCNGANLAFRKTVFSELNGYEGNTHIASGDDEFLMRKVEAAYSAAAIRFNAVREAIVTTTPQPTAEDFFQQRIRWAAKWKHHEGTNSKLLAVAVFLFNLSMMVLPVFVLMGDVSAYIMVACLLAKATTEYFFLVRVHRWLGNRWRWPAFVLWQVVYAGYAVGVALAALFSKPVWKGRETP